MSLKKALIVDDSRLAQFVLKKMLIEQDMEVDTSESAEEALGYLARQKPDMIFLDHTMPGMNGLEVLKVIKGNPETSSIPVMMYTSQEDSTYMNRAIELGAVDVLPKQLKTTELEQALARLQSNDKTDATIDYAANEAINSEAEKQELKQLVMDAEAALEQETIEQKLRLKIDNQGEKFDERLAHLKEKIDTLIPAAENAHHKQAFWNNLFWGTVYIITVAVFATIYIKQNHQIDQLSVFAQQQNTTVNPTPTKTSSPSTPTPAAIAPLCSANFQTYFEIHFREWIAAESY